VRQERRGLGDSPTGSTSSSVGTRCAILQPLPAILAQVRLAMSMTSGADGAAVVDAVPKGDAVTSQRGWRCTSSSTRTGELSSACSSNVHSYPGACSNHGAPTSLSMRTQP